MKIYTGRNVFDEALDRIRWLFDEFEHIYVNTSGGKDSTALLGLCLMVAEEKNRLPLNALFLDQEAEWQSVIDYMRVTMSDPRIQPWWFQMPIRLSSATSQRQKWLYCWEESMEGKWVREKEPNSIHENIYGTMTFADVFTKVLKVHHPKDPAVHLAGVRSQEAPGRHLGLTAYPTYKGETWGKSNDKGRGNGEHMYKTPEVGSSVIFTDSLGVDHDALVLAVHAEKCVNVIYVSSDDRKVDAYGRQVEREPTSMDHVSIHGAHGNYWRWPGEDPWSR